MDNGESSYRRFLSGDQAALDELLTLYRLKLIFFIDRIVRDPDAAEDIAIDVFVDLLTKPHSVRPGTSVKTYLFLRSRSRALDYLRHRKFLSDAPLPEHLAAEALLEEQVLADERKRALNDALKTLPPDMQQALYLVYFEELSYQDTAAVMKKTSKQVDNLLYQGKQRLRAILRKEGLEL